MKATWTLNPLAFAIAAGLAFSVQAQEVPVPPFDDPDAAAIANVTDTQTSNGNYVLNQGTANTGSLEGSLDNSAGNTGVNIAGGDHNQQANAAALATADENFVFGQATATINLNQTATNGVDNYSTQNNASVASSGNNASGNVGINVAAGVFNQQKNDLAAAVSGGFIASATNTTNQTSQGNVTNNYAVLETTSSADVTLNLTGGTGTYTGTSDQVGDVYLDTWTGITHGAGTGGGHIDVDTEVDGAQDPNGDGGAFLFNEEGDIILGGTVTGSIPLVSLQQAVVNNATVSGSLNGATGNVGLNVAAGSGNQQANSLAIAAGCAACPTTPAAGQ